MNEWEKAQLATAKQETETAVGEEKKKDPSTIEELAKELAAWETQTKEEDNAKI